MELIFGHNMVIELIGLGHIKRKGGMSYKITDKKNSFACSENKDKSR